VLALNSSPQQLATALRAAAPAKVDDRPALQKMSNKKLLDSVVAFAKHLRTLVAQNEQQEEDNSMHWHDAIPFPTTQPPTEEQKKGFGSSVGANESTSPAALKSVSANLTYKNDFQVDAVNYRDELIRRLGPQGPPNVPGRIPISLSLNGWVAPQSVDATADYLEELAKKLPDQN
jgi:hypothetical protein